VDFLQWNPNRLQWPGGRGAAAHTTWFVSFSANLGRNLFGKKHVIPNRVECKWQGILPLNFILDGNRSGLRGVLRRKLAFFGLLGTVPWQSMFGSAESTKLLIKDV
jgi:hypothetical protein